MFSHVLAPSSLLAAVTLLTACSTAAPAPSATATRPAPNPAAAAPPSPVVAASPAVSASPAAAASPSVIAQPAGVASNQEAIRELQAVEQAYKQAQQAFNAGDRAKALELMNTAYLDHFERTEAWMDQKLSQEYRESVESAVSRDLRRKLRDNSASDAEITAQFPVALQRIEEAQQRLAALP